MNSDSERIPPDAFQKAMNKAVPRYTGEKSMQDSDKNPLDSLIKPTPEDDPRKPRGDSK